MIPRKDLIAYADELDREAAAYEEALAKADVHERQRDVAVRTFATARRDCAAALRKAADGIAALPNIGLSIEPNP